MDLKIVGWTNYDSAFPTANITDETMEQVISCVVSAIAENGYVFSSEDHQNSDTGVPVFDNGTCFRASMRAWGTIMALAYPELDGSETDYMDFYMSTPVKSVMPKKAEIGVPVAKADNFNGMIIRQDAEILNQSVQMGMPFVTTDKALNYILDAIKNASENDEN